MTRSLPAARRRRLAVHGTVAAAAAFGLALATSGTAEAADVRLDYPVTGTTHLSGTDSDLALGPGTLKATADLAAGTLSADTELPPADGEFKLLGIPVSVTTELVETEPTTGTIAQDGAVSTTSKMTIKLKNLKVGGIPMPVGSRCQTKEPATISLDSQEGFNVLTGGTLSGEYTIPRFEHCLLATPVINGMIPGDGNTISLDLAQAQQPED
ncbi:hypothetical protein [Streptomyces xiaopingdaonensis]|uniref:hypothetical protein n=1 Tax=Streptomyces xiaopingdaonensis TaxID=1565415 RepID=UPI0002FBF67C|nr:hypothetical protein [Streptomyces xiaopingdaonensis]